MSQKGWWLLVVMVVVLVGIFGQRRNPREFFTSQPLFPVILLGDSVLNNAAYVQPKETVAAQIQAKTGITPQVLAKDGATISDVILTQVPQVLANSRVFLSVGGNDILTTGQKPRISDIKRLLKQLPPTAVVSILTLYRPPFYLVYHPIIEAFNRELTVLSVDIIDMTDLELPGNLTSGIEPSAQGARKIAEKIAQVIS